MFGCSQCLEKIKLDQSVFTCNSCDGIFHKGCCCRCEPQDNVGFTTEEWNESQQYNRELIERVNKRKHDAKIEYINRLDNKTEN